MTIDRGEKVEGGAAETARPLILSMGGAYGNLSTAHQSVIGLEVLTCN